MRPFPNDTEVACDLPDRHAGGHEGVLRDYAYPGSQTVMRWFEEDRRTYHGDWPGACEAAGCVLPRHHNGNHA